MNMPAENFTDLELSFICKLKTFTLIDLGINGYTGQLMVGPTPYDAMITNHFVLRVADTSDNKTKFFVTLESNPSSKRKRLCIQTEKLHQSQASDPSISRWPPKAFLAAALPMAKTEVAELAPKALAKRKRA
jgi:hypothetical protein